MAFEGVSGKGREVFAPLLDNYVISEDKSTYKVVQSGKHFEVYRVSIPFELGKKGCRIDPSDKKKADRNDEYKRRNANVARNKIRRLVNSNFKEGGKFVTLTFADTYEFDITDLEDCNRQYRNFMYRMRKEYGLFDYITVVEFQDSYGRGAVHYHMIADLPFVPAKKLRAMWGHGFVKINLLKYGNMGVYVAKYITKYMYDKRFEGRRKFFTSKGLQKPKVYYGMEAIRLIAMVMRFAKLKYNTTYESEYNGVVSYYAFYLGHEEGGDSG